MLELHCICFWKTSCNISKDNIQQQQQQQGRPHKVDYKCRTDSQSHCECKKTQFKIIFGPLIVSDKMLKVKFNPEMSCSHSVTNPNQISKNVGVIQKWITK